ncbi:hypothetical protein DL89DRAFT_298106 [Linderina pennispora]|uniref:Uncharacterized protein n=1 Tax=Linderina pennispora TaxID=61395 RepID=A0A1Y1VRV3_9FUNG|nr:uncharacterized protein DL89DRAFT_298106 [Linderina pennispora]ORX63756.1 hypothetical protein DL89DRAFT_298106 [Linderina pennispora]
MSDSQKVIIVFKEGGKLGDTLALINGISATIPNSFTSSLTGHAAIDSVENDGEVSIQ